MSLKSDQRAILEKVLALPVVDFDLARYGLSSEYEGKKLTKAEALMIQLVERGCSGDMTAIKEIMDRLLGKPAQFINAEIKQTSYYDFLMEIVHTEQRDKIPLREQEVIEVKPEPDNPIPDIGADLLGDLG